MVTSEDAAYVRGLFPEIEEIQDKELAEKVVEIWAETWHASAWPKIEDARKNPTNVGERRLVPHVRAVTREAIDMAQSFREFHGVGVNMDYLIAGSLLHDVCKLMEYQPKGDGAGKTRYGELVQHGVYSGYKVLEKGLPEELVHMAISHTTKSHIAPVTLEGAILHYVDYADSDALLYAEGQKLQVGKAYS